MDANWRPTQGTESTMDTSDWRTQLQPDSRQRIVNKIMDTLKRHLPVSGQDGLHELHKIAQRFEEKIYTAATSQSDYLRKISLKMLKMENETQNAMVNAIQSNAGGLSNKPIDSGIPMQSQIHNPGQSHAIPVPNQSQSRQQLLSQNIQNSIAPPVSNIGLTPIQNVVGPNSNEQNNLPKLQQHQQQQPHLINRQNNLFNMHQQQLGSNVPGLQQQQLLAPQSGNSGMQPNQHSAHMVQQSKVPVQQQSQQNVTNLLQSQGQQSQPQAPQQQLMPWIQSQPAQMQQQLGMQQQPNLLQQDMQQRLQGLSSLLQQQNVLDQQKQLYQSQGTLPDSSSTSLDSTAQTGKSGGDDWQEEVFQKIKSMKESYLPELSEMLQKIEAKLQQHEALPDGPRSDQLLKLKIFKTMLERLMAFLQVSKSSVLPSFKEKLVSYEKQIVNFIQTNRPRKAMSSMQGGQLPPPHMHPVPQSQSQLTQVQSHENQMNSQMQSTNFQSFVNFLQQAGASSLQQNSLNAPQQTNTNHLSSQGGGSVLRQNSNPLQPGSTMLQHQQLKQPQEQQMLQNQQLKHLQQRQLLQMQQMLQKQQQLQQSTKQQVPAHMQTHQHLPSGQRSAYPQQQFKSGGSYPVSSLHLLQAASPQISQHSSPQVDQQNLPSLAKASTPLQSANSPFVGPTPSPPLAPSPMPGDSEKPISVVSTVSNAANIGHQQNGIAILPAESLAIVTPGIISPSSPLLAKFSGPNGAHGSAWAISSARLTVALVFFLILWLVFYCC